MKLLIIKIIFCIFFMNAQAQTFSAKLDNPLSGMPEMDVVLLPFGMDYPIKIGVLKKDGTLSFDLSNSDISSIPQEHLEMFLSEYLNENLSLKCDSSTEFQQPENLKAQRGGYIGLWYRNRWAGTIFPVTHEELIHWQEDEAYIEPVLGSYYEITYVSEPVEINTICTNTWHLKDKKIEAEHTYNFSLQEGFNFLEYQIQKIYKTNPSETSSKPSKVLIKNVDDFSKIKWIAKYF
ncbi:MAG: hypothetical protein WDZ45_07140 [Flavobacteriaceae bacterium]